MKFNHPLGFVSNIPAGPVVPALSRPRSVTWGADDPGKP
jgi:hypothetical protein